MNSSPDAFYASLAALDSFLLAIWLLALLILGVVNLLNVGITKRWEFFRIKPLNFNVPSNLFWTVLLLAALAVRLHRLFLDAFWYDETFTAAMANTSLEQFWTALSGDVHPPLFYLISWGINHFSQAEWAFRLPSLIAGMALIYAVYLLALELFHDESTAKLSALLVAFMPALIHYSAEARYPMLLALSVSMAWLGLLKNESRLFAIAAFCVPLLHATGIIYSFILIVAAFLKGSTKFTLAMLFASLPLLFYFFMNGQASDLKNGFWLWQMIPLWHIIDSTVLKPLSGDTGLVMFLAYLVIAYLSLLSSWLLLRRSSKTFWYFIAIALLVPMAVFVAGYAFHPVYLPRALIASAIPLIIGMAALARRNIINASMLIIVMFASVIFLFIPDDEMDLRTLFSHCEGSDYTYSTSTNMSIISLYYAPSESLAYADGNNQHQELPMASREALGFDFTPPEMIAENACLIVYWNFYTTEAERNRVELLRQYQVSSEIVSESLFWDFEVIWLQFKR